jgi:hypothetical protein
MIVHDTASHVMTDLEQCRGGLAQRLRAVCPSPEMDAAPAVVAKIQLGKSWLVAARKGGVSAALLLKPGKREFDVFAGT